MKEEVQFDCYWYLEFEFPGVVQWYKADVMLNDTTRIAGTSTNFLSVSGITGSDYGVYQCYVEDFLSRVVVLTGVFKIDVNTTYCTLLFKHTYTMTFTYTSNSSHTESTGPLCVH